MQKRARKDLKRLSILPNCLNHFEKTINIFSQTNFMISPALVSENNLSYFRSNSLANSD